MSVKALPYFALLFLQNFDIIETLDTIREEKILEYVIVLQVSE